MASYISTENVNVELRKVAQVVVNKSSLSDAESPNAWNRLELGVHGTVT